MIVDVCEKKEKIKKKLRKTDILMKSSAKF